MIKEFNYAQAISELEDIVAQIEDPKVSVDDMDKYLKRSHELINQCREYLRGVRFRIEETDIL